MIRVVLVERKESAPIEVDDFAGDEDVVTDSENEVETTNAGSRGLYI